LERGLPVRLGTGQFKTRSAPALFFWLFHFLTNNKEIMSHFTTIKTQIRDIEALRSACSELGLTLLQNSAARGYSQNQIPGEYVIRLKGPYDVALNREDNASYGLTTDWWEGHVEKEVGKNYGRLLQLYGVHKAMGEARRKGCLVQRRNQSNGCIKLVIAGGAL
jgi:hypothetical protein